MTKNAKPNLQHPIFNLNWGNSIVLVFIIFASFIGIMVYKMNNEKIELVRADYYQKELDFQKQIEIIKNTNNLKKKIAMTYLPEQNRLNIVFPTKVQSGEVKFFRPSDQALDTKVSLISLKEGLVHLSTQMLKKGFWKVQISWTDGKQEYFSEQELFI